MGAIQFTNSASSLLAASIDDNDTVVQVTSTEGALFPSPGVGQYFKLALVNAEGDLEICHCTSRTGDLLTVTRAQEGTAAQAWTNGATRCELRTTAGTMDNLLQKTGDTMSGDLDMAGNEVQEARLTEDPVIEGGQLVGTAIRGTENDSSNEIVVPGDGSKATAGGSPILTEDDGIAEQMPAGSVIMWYGSLGNIPSGWQLCDGTNGTPDMRGAFPRGAGGAFTLGGSGGSTTSSGTTDGGGAHTHGGTDAHVLDITELPDHTHGGYVGNNYERGINITTYQPTNRQGPVLPGTTRNDSGLIDADGTNSTSVTGSPLTTGVVGSVGAGHSHTIPDSGTHTHALSGISILPTFKQLYFIMKVS